MKKRGEEEVKEEKKFKRFDKILILVIVVLITIAIYLMKFYVDECSNFECFKEKMEKCEKARYVNEEPEASWGYEIKGRSDEQCEIEVKLLLAKRGELGIDKIVGYRMNCFYPSGIGNYPEKDLRMCNGRLKEELQQIIINKLHSYIIENLGQIDLKINSV